MSARRPESSARGVLWITLSGSCEFDDLGAGWQSRRIDELVRRFDNTLETPDLG